MKLYGVGNAILHFREKYQLPQSSVCAGICSTATLSRIETGEREFDSLLSETLLGRLGKAANHFEFVLNDSDYELCRIRYQLEKHISEKQVKEAKELLERYEIIAPKEQILYQQHLLFCRAQILKMEGKEGKEVRDLFYEAIILKSKNDRGMSQSLLYV